MNGLNQMNEIVGESGEAGEGCLMSLIKPIAALAVAAAVVLTPGVAQAELTPRKPTCAPAVVPNVVGMLVFNAEKVLGEAGFMYHVNPTKSPFGILTVRATVPTGGTLASQCTVVEVWRGR